MPDQRKSGKHTLVGEFPVFARYIHIISTQQKPIPAAFYFAAGACNLAYVSLVIYYYYYRAYLFQQYCCTHELLLLCPL